MSGWTVAVALGLWLGMPETAHAWGPATHIGLGASLLGQLSLLPAGLAALLARHRLSYLYGNIAADVVFAKRLSRVKQFCHHWSTALGLLDTAECERTKAFAYGYLSHLAADTVAHGKYVPRQVTMSECSVNFGHFRWELRAEGLEPASTRRLLAEVLEADHDEANRVLVRHVTKTLLPYGLNRRLFNSVNALAIRRGFNRTILAWDRFSRWSLSPQLVSDYRAECVDRMVSVLRDGTESAVLREDPNGTSALMQLHVRRREVRRLRRRGVPVARRVSEASRGFAPARQSADSLALSEPAVEPR